MFRFTLAGRLTCKLACEDETFLVVARTTPVTSLVEDQKLKLFVDQWILVGAHIRIDGYVAVEHPEEGAATVRFIATRVEHAASPGSSEAL